ncbi:SubName: Full=Uncharacterized protein {ECO:0000313/EMBL:CCA68144.1} [Serendipita indica DSM 11827]|nr:SubName: Full=Uncharacterized protein {ECO:0000313/EMBL:CCA68144.1} [Serendipita indica DSM 11827]
MVLNADGCLLAVAGAHHAAIVVLPSNARGSKAPIIECKSIQVAPYYYGVKGSPRVVKIEWHPLAEGYRSLFVLTADGVLKEYDVTVSSDDALQTFNFVQKRKKRNTFNTDDPLASEAISFSFGCLSNDRTGARGCSDWTPLTVYGLMRNGDLYAICPVGPSRLRIDQSYILSLEAYVRGKEALALNDYSLHKSTIPAFNPMSSFASSVSSITSAGEELDLPSVYDHQRKYISSLTRQLPADDSISQDIAQSTELLKELSISSISSTASKTRSALVTLDVPTNIKLEPESQGPFRFRPAPGPSPTPEWEELATDILYTHLFTDQPRRASTKSADAGVILITYSDGRVDVCLDLVKVEAVWSRPGVTANSPVTLVLETIDLDYMAYFRPVQPQGGSSGSSKPLLTSAPLHPKFLAQNHPTMMLDPVYGDTVYVYHSFGVHALWLGWMADMSAALQKSLTKEGEKGETVLEEDSGSPMRAASPIVGLAVSSDLFVDYSMLALTSNSQAVPLELQMRIPEPHEGDVTLDPETAAMIERLQKMSSDGTTSDLAQSSDAAGSSRHAPKKHPSYVPYNSEPFTGLPPYTPPIIPPVPHIVVGKDEATPDQLRQFARAVAVLSQSDRSVQGRPGVMEDRIFYLMKERDRQLTTLRVLQPRVHKLVGIYGTGGQRAQTLARLDRIAAALPALLKRVDAIMQRVMDSYSGELTASEKQWFGELKRMHKDVVSSGDGSALSSKVEMLSKQLETLLPLVKDMQEQEKAAQADNKAELGSKQMLDIGRHLGSEDEHIKAAVEKTQQLAARVGITTTAVGEDVAET